MKTVAAQFLGFAGTENKGLAGLEKSYDERARAARRRAGRRARPGRPLAQDDLGGRSPCPAEDVRLTIDRSIQFTAERCSPTPCASTRAKGGDGDRHGPGAPARSSPWPTRRWSTPTSSATARQRAAQPRRHRHLRARFDLQGDHRRRRPLREGLVTPSSAASPCPDNCRSATASSTNRTHAARSASPCARILAESSNIGAVDAGLEARQAALLKWIQRLRLRQDDRHRLPRRGRRPRAAARPVVGVDDRQRAHGTGHRRHADADGERLRDGRQRRRHGQAARGDAGRDDDQPRRRAASRAQGQGRATAARHDEGRRRRRAPAPRRRSRATRSPARRGRRRSRCPTAAATRRPPTSPPSSAWCRRTHPRLVVLVMVDEPHHDLGRRRRGAGVQRDHQFALQHLEIEP